MGGHQPPMQGLFGKNVCENVRIGFCWGGEGRCVPAAPSLDPPTKIDQIFQFHPRFTSIDLKVLHKISLNIGLVLLISVNLAVEDYTPSIGGFFFLILSLF